MSNLVPDGEWTDAQLAFMKSLEVAGATKAEYAVPIDRTTGLTARDLQALIDSGVVREAAANGYYLYPNQVRRQPLSRKDRLVQHMDALEAAHDFQQPQEFSTKRLLKTILFWIIIILIPIILLQALGKKR